MKPIHRAAKNEMKRLHAELLASGAADLFREYIDAAEIVAKYEGREVERPRQESETAVSVIPKSGQTRITGTSEAARVRQAAKEYLMEIGKRASSGEIADALMERGVQIGGKDRNTRASRVSAHLSASKKDFNNKAGEGYGLVQAA